TEPKRSLALLFSGQGRRDGIQVAPVIRREILFNRCRVPAVAEILEQAASERLVLGLGHARNSTARSRRLLSGLAASVAPSCRPRGRRRRHLSDERALRTRAASVW